MCVCVWREVRGGERGGALPGILQNLTSLTMNQTCDLCSEVWSLNHWTAGEVHNFSIYIYFESENALLWYFNYSCLNVLKQSNSSANYEYVIPKVRDLWFHCGKQFS